ncbi:hypothetical protein, partial [Bifidobacterium longum]|uniref:hypothetical protein n=1 Tax=Bifidobacterium longum TaxID=216816 RepID=UPI001F1DBEAB
IDSCTGPDFSVLVFDFGSFLLTGTKLTPEVSSAYYENGGIVRFRMEGNFKYSYIRGVQLSWFAKKSRNRLPGQKNLAR